MPKALIDNEFFIDFDTANCDSEGNSLSDSQVSFFNQSKCRDEDGSLYLVYRASNKEYDAFDKEQARIKQEKIKALSLEASNGD